MSICYFLAATAKKNAKKVVKVTKSTTKTSKATIAAAKKAVAAMAKKGKAAPALKKTKSTTGASNGRIVVKVTTKKRKSKDIVFPGQQPVVTATKKPVLQVARKVVAKPSATNVAKTKKATSAAKNGIQTAEAIARDITHPKREEVNELLKAFNRGWINAAKFNEVLQQTLF